MGEVVAVSLRILSLLFLYLFLVLCIDKILDRVGLVICVRCGKILPANKSYRYLARENVINICPTCWKGR